MVDGPPKIVPLPVDLYENLVEVPPPPARPHSLDAAFAGSLRRTSARTGAWVRSLLERKPTRLVTVAIANKTARTAWALLAKGESYTVAPAV